MKPQLVKGKQLTPEQVKQVKAAFVYRWTIENLPRAKQLMESVGHPTIEPVSDAQFINEHAFYFRKDGKLASCPHHCEPVFLAE